MKGNEIYPTVDNLEEIEPHRLKVLKAEDTEEGVLVTVGESTNRQCKIRVKRATLEFKIAVSSLEEPDKINAVCFWNKEKFIQSRKNHTAVALNINKDQITVDLQLLNRKNKNYLALTKIAKRSESD
ncbi:hypothetical protein GL2_42260 [Microbulbifer sp. GL-2]|nr:hypothetical protein GL2_42260 [Microbulbifer sp. GL-2]